MIHQAGLSAELQASLPLAVAMISLSMDRAIKFHGPWVNIRTALGCLNPSRASVCLLVAQGQGWGEHDVNLSKEIIRGLSHVCASALP